MFTLTSLLRPVTFVALLVLAPAVGIRGVTAQTGFLVPDVDPAFNTNDASSNEVIAWNAWVVNHSFKAFFPHGSWQFAQLTAAVHDALNTIDQRYDFYVGDVSASAGLLNRRRIQNASPEAAVAAAHATLFPIHVQTLAKYDGSGALAILPAQQAVINNQTATYFDSRIQRLVDAGVDQQTINDGIAIGRAAAQSLLDAKVNDGHDRFEPYAPNTGKPGQWYPNPGTNMAYAQFADSKPWAITCTSCYQAPDHPSIDSPQYLADLAETINYGGQNGGQFKNSSYVSKATPDQANVGLWFGGLGGSYAINYVMQFLLTRDYPNLNLWDTARLFALVQIATEDASIVNYYNKRINNFWRPVHAAHSTAVPVELQDPFWTSLSPTPNNEEYPAGHPTQGGAAGGVLALALGVDPTTPFRGGPLSLQFRSNIGPLVISNIQDYFNAVIDGRVYGGMHLRGSCKAGQTQGRQIATEVFNNILARVNRGHHNGN